jgi:CheY-like chemotaxis protein
MRISSGLPGNLKVLIVDDDPLLCEVMEVVLGMKARVAEVQTATSAAAALDLCVQFWPDVVIVDHFMPVIDGDKLGGMLREIHPDTWLLSMTGSSGKPKPEWADVHVMKNGDLFRMLDEMFVGGIAPA